MTQTPLSKTPPLQVLHTATIPDRAQQVEEPSTAPVAAEAIPLIDTLWLISDDNLQTKFLSQLITDELNLPCKILDNSSLPRLAPPALLLVDCQRVNNDNTNQLLHHLHHQSAESRVALLNAQPKPRYECLAEWPQVKGIFYDDCEHWQLVKGLKELLNGGHWFPRHLTQKLLDTHRRPPTFGVAVKHFTPRESQIIRLLAQGTSNAEIASQLDLSEHTVKSHLYNLFKKIGVKNRLKAYHWAQQNL